MDYCQIEKGLKHGETEIPYSCLEALWAWKKTYRMGEEVRASLESYPET